MSAERIDIDRTWAAAERLSSFYVDLTSLDRVLAYFDREGIDLEPVAGRLLGIRE